MIEIAICDDDPIFLETVKNRIESYLQEKEIENYRISDFTSSVVCYETIQSGALFDAIFLGITMAEMHGLDSARKIRQSNDTVILIFLTSSLDYAIEGYRLQVLRYILKDRVEELLPECMDTLLDKLDHMESELRAFGFLRIHKSFLANMEHIGQISNYQLTLVSGELFSIPRERFQKVRTRFYSYKGGTLGNRWTAKVSGGKS